MSLGFQNAGFDVLAAYDNWQPAIDIYSRNFKFILDVFIQYHIVNSQIRIANRPASWIRIKSKKTLFP